MEENDAVQPGLTDAIAVLKGLRNYLCAHRVNGPSMLCTDGKALNNADDEVLRALKILVPLSKLRAEGVQAGEPVADSTLPLEKALYELVNKIDTGLDSGDLVQDARRASTVLDAIMTGGDLVACAHTFFKECGEDKWRDRYERSLDFRIGWNACLDAIDEARTKRAALASAPVAGEAQDPVGEVFRHGEGRDENGPRVGIRMLPAAAGLPHGTQVYAAPQASEAVRNAALAALESAQRFIRNGVEFGYIRMPDVDTPDPAHRTPGLIEAAIRAIKTQADKDGGDCAKGAGDEPRPLAPDLTNDLKGWADDLAEQKQGADDAAPEK